MFLGSNCSPLALLLSPCLPCRRGEWERIGEVVGGDGDGDNVAGGGSKWHNGQLWDYGEQQSGPDLGGWRVE